MTGVGYHTAAPKIGLLKQYSYSNGCSTTLDYTVRRTPLNTLSPVFQQSFAYDNRGNLKTLADPLRPNRNKTFTYDQLNRMTGFNGPWGAGSYTFGASGDRTTKTVDGMADTYSYAAGRLQSVTGRSFTYNIDGDLASIIQGGTTSTLEYDPFHMLRAYKSYTTPLAEFGYDAHDGRAYNSPSA